MRNDDVARVAAVEGDDPRVGTGAGPRRRRPKSVAEIAVELVRINGRACFFFVHDRLQFLHAGQAPTIAIEVQAIAIRFRVRPRVGHRRARLLPREFGFLIQNGSVHDVETTRRAIRVTMVRPDDRAGEDGGGGNAEGLTR